MWGCVVPFVVCRQGDRKMSIEMLSRFFLWCTIINYGILLVWFGFFAFGRDWMQRFHGQWFRLSNEQFDAIHYAGMALFKIGIFLLNLVPFLVLWMIG
jgi:hypothetical protein